MNKPMTRPAMEIKEIGIDDAAFQSPLKSSKESEMSSTEISNLPAFTYPMHFALTQDDKTYFLVTCRDLPQVITDGNTIEEARVNAADALDEVIASLVGSYDDYVKQSGDNYMDAHTFWRDRMHCGKLPYPSPPLECEEMVTAKCDEVN